MEGPRLTEERLRNHLDGNQPMREQMCLALLPLLGPYTREQPRRPKGGPDGGRDIEAVFKGQTTAWGAVGFKNGGGRDDGARREIEKKFRDDLEAALKENPSLAVFVFFTNVDLTPSSKEDLHKYAQGKKVTIVEIFDFERLRHVLDSPEGLLARLQYLEIPMSAAEQAALVGKFGSQLQSAVTSRFDRVERTLAQMERFLQFQKPILRLDLYVELLAPATSAEIGDEAILFRMSGIHDISKRMSIVCANVPDHSHSGSTLVMQAYIWNEEAPNTLTLGPFLASSRTVMVAYNEVSLSNVGNRIRISDLTTVCVEACCTDGFRGRIKRIAADANGYELFGHDADVVGSPVTLYKFPKDFPYALDSHRWVMLLGVKEHNYLFHPPRASGRFLPLARLEAPPAESVEAKDSSPFPVRGL